MTVLSLSRVHNSIQIERGELHTHSMQCRYSVYGHASNVTVNAFIYSAKCFQIGHSARTFLVAY